MTGEAAIITIQPLPVMHGSIDYRCLTKFVILRHINVCVYYLSIAHVEQITRLSVKM